MLLIYEDYILYPWRTVFPWEEIDLQWDNHILSFLPLVILAKDNSTICGHGKVLWGQSWWIYLCCVLLGDGESGMSTRGDEGEAQKNKSIILYPQVLETGWMPHRATWGSTGLGQEAERAWARGEPRPRPVLEFPRERPGWGKQFRIG